MFRKYINTVVTWLTTTMTLQYERFVVVSVNNHIQTMQLQKFFAIVEQQYPGYKIRKHQQDAVLKAIRNKQQKLGLCLTHWMGLGKTLMAVMILAYFILEAKQKQQQKHALMKVDNNIKPKQKTKRPIRALIITPATSIETVWVKETTPLFDSDIFVYQGPKRDDNYDKVMNSTILITTYDMILSHYKQSLGYQNDNDYDDKNSNQSTQQFNLFTTFEWDVIVMDEIQEIKNGLVNNNSAQHCKKAKSIYDLVGRSSRTFVLGLTGTLVGNTTLEIASIMRALNPGHQDYSQRKFWMNIADKPTLIQKHLKVLSIHAIRSDCQDMQPLPTKTEYCVLAPLSDMQIEKSQHIFREGREQLSMYQGANREEQGAIRFHIFHLLDKMRKLCSSAYFIGESGKVALTSLSTSDLMLNCCKLAPGVDIVKNALDHDEAIVIFVQWHYTMDTWYRILKELYPEQEIFCFTGQIPSEERTRIIETFQRRGPAHRILLMMLKVGSVSISLTAANHVILVDPWWSPSTERQAIARVFREGQTRPVFVYRLLADGKCADIIIRNKQKYKANEVIQQVFPEQSSMDYDWKGDTTTFEETRMLFMQTSMNHTDYRNTCSTQQKYSMTILQDDTVIQPNNNNPKRKQDANVATDGTNKRAKISNKVSSQ